MKNKIPSIDNLVKKKQQQKKEQKKDYDAKVLDREPNSINTSEYNYFWCKEKKIVW